MAARGSPSIPVCTSVSTPTSLYVHLYPYHVYIIHPWLCVTVCPSISVRLHLCQCIHMRGYSASVLSTSIAIHPCPSVSVCTCVCTCICIPDLHICICTFTCTQKCTSSNYVYQYLCPHAHVNLRVCTRTCAQSTLSLHVCIVCFSCVPVCLCPRVCSLTSSGICTSLSS